MSHVLHYITNLTYIYHPDQRWFLLGRLKEKCNVYIASTQNQFMRKVKKMCEGSYQVDTPSNYHQKVFIGNSLEQNT